MPDLNLLIPLDVLLAEGSVASAARRLGLSPSATSRALTRLREVTGDPLLVRAGRKMVPTPRALELREQLGPLVEAAFAVLRPAAGLDMKTLHRQFVIRSSEGFAETFGPDLLAMVSAQAPGVTLRFVTKPDKASAPLRDGEIDLETGVVDAATAPELRAVQLFRDRWIAAVRVGHPMLDGPMAATRFAACDHVQILRSGLRTSELDEAAHLVGIDRRIGTIVGGFSTALAFARETDMVAVVPERHTAALRKGMACVDLPFEVPPFAVSLLWHPRMEGDQGHCWLRGCLRTVCDG
ncbi:MAG: LysR family transcriptional regulator [Paracoccaceae bacterium]